MKRIAQMLIIYVAIPSISSAVTIDTVRIGHPGNPGQVQRTGEYGSIGYEFDMGRTEISNSQYVEFLNAIAVTDPNSLWNAGMALTYGGIIRTGLSEGYFYSVRSAVNGVGPGGSKYDYAQKPVVEVSWYSALRFANWLHNGQPNGPQSAETTEDGSYTFEGPSSVGGRNFNATWVMPNEHEWHKAAFYDGTSGTYFDYPTGTNIEPNNSFPSEDTGNSANFFDGEFATEADSDYTTGNPDYPLTNVGAYTKSASPNGTFDQGGNVWEWNEEALFGQNNRRIRGGVWNNTPNTMASSNRTASGAFGGTYNVGFRVALVPEPNTMACLCVSAALLSLFRHRRSS